MREAAPRQDRLCIAISGPVYLQILLSILVVVSLLVSGWAVYSLEKNRDKLLKMVVANNCVNDLVWRDVNSGKPVDEVAYNNFWIKCRNF